MEEGRIGLFGMVVMGFFWVCGGMYGNEELLGTAPPLLVLSALVVVPLCHSLPVSMMIAECGTAWPADGGLPVFVQRAFGDTVGAYNTFFTWLNCLVDAAIYPVMAASYTKELLGHYDIRAVDERLVCVTIVGCMTAMQLRGLDWMVRFSTLLLLLSLGPTVLFALLGAPHLSSAPLLASSGPCNPTLLLSFVFWLDSGFYSLADIAGEVDKPGRVLPLACAILQPLNMLVNLLPLAVALCLDSDASHYAASTGYFSALAVRVGGWWLGKLFFCASMVSNLGNYSSQVVSAEKLCSFFIESQLTALAAPDAPPCAELLPRAPCCALYRRLPSTRTGRYLSTHSEEAGQHPWIILFNAGCILLLILLFPLDMLIELVALIMTINMSLFLLAFVQLRRVEPHTPRPFRLPGGTTTLVVAVASPLCFILANLYILLAEREHGAARLLFLFTAVAVGAAVQRAYRRIIAAELGGIAAVGGDAMDTKDLAVARVGYHVPGRGAKTAAAWLIRLLATAFALSSLLVGWNTLYGPADVSSPGGKALVASPPPPPPSSWRAATRPSKQQQAAAASAAASAAAAAAASSAAKPKPKPKHSRTHSAKPHSNKAHHDTKAIADRTGTLARAKAAFAKARARGRAKDGGAGGDVPPLAG